MSLARPLLSRLHRDLAELHDSPYPGVAVFTDDANMRKLCLVLTPPSGPWKDLSLHFDVELPDNWPSSPPRIKTSVSGIDHPNLFDDYICCDLLKEMSWLERGYTGGYTPALTLRGLFLQFLTFFSNNKVEQDYGGEIEIGDDVISQYICENDMTQRLFPSGCIYHLSNNEAAQQEKARLEALWKADKSPEVTVKSYSTLNGNIVQTTKETMLTIPDGKLRVHKFEQKNPRWGSTYSIIKVWRCKKCPYGSELVPHWVVPQQPAEETDFSLLLAPPPKCLLGILNDDIIFTIASYLPSESILSFSTAYPRLRVIVNSMHVLLQRELRCFFLRTPLQRSVLGIGIAFEGGRTLSSDFDWLSEEAYENFTVRKSIQKRDFQYFLPLAFSRPHFERVQGRIWIRLAEIDRAVRRNTNRLTSAPRHPHEVVGVIYKMMNNIVVSLMKSCDDVYNTQRGISSTATLLHASEKAVISYCHLFHLLICLSRHRPQILQDATARLQRFVGNPASRVKTHVPDLGELIVLVTLVLALPSVDPVPITWNHLNGPILEEVVVRNVRWVLKDSPDLEFLEHGLSEYRLAKTFQHSRTSLRLLMFQITILDTFVNSYASDISRLDDNYGFAEKSIPRHIVKEIKEIYKVATWPAFFDRVKYAKGRAFGKEKFSDILRQAVRKSGERGYHTPSRRRQLSKSDRELAERLWRQQLRDAVLG